MHSTKITLGRIGDAFGVKGWVHVFSFTDPAENIFNHAQWQICAYQKRNAIWRAVEVEFHKTHGNAFIVKFKGCDDRDQALLLKNHTIAIERDSLPALKENQYYWNDLVGLEVISTDNFSFGKIDHLFEAGSNTIMSVQGKTTHYIPYTKDVVQLVDLEKKVIRVQWQPIN